MKVSPDAVIADIETDGLLDTVTKIHCIQIGSLNGPDVTLYKGPTLAAGLKRLHDAPQVLGHNFISYDYVVIERFHPGTLVESQVVDTMALSRLKNPTAKDHTLATLGKALGVYKGDWKGPWDTLTPEMEEYAKQDIVVVRAIFHSLKSVLAWGHAADTEHSVQWALAAQERNGFKLDLEYATRLEGHLRGELLIEAEAVKSVFPPVWISAGEFTPKGNNKKQGYNAGCPLTKVRLEYFNPSSRIQIGKRLQGLGWKPKDFGKDAYPTVDEKILVTLPYPEAKRLVRYFTISKKLGQLSDGKGGWLKLVQPDGRVRGRVNGNGAITCRMAHSKPNTANIDSSPEMRRCWIARDGWVLVGADASALEACMFAHFLHRYDNGSYRDKYILSDEDLHTANMNAIKAQGIVVARQGAKRLLYAKLYGAQFPKLGRTVKEEQRAAGIAVSVGPDKVIGAKVNQALERTLIGIKPLTAKLQEVCKANKGWIRGLDGRSMVIKSQHSILNTLLQGAGALVMKKALAILWERGKGTYGHLWAFCANVHDEWQMECQPDFAEELGQMAVQAIRDAGTFYKLRCPLDGEFKVGSNWSETH